MILVSIFLVGLRDDAAEALLPFRWASMKACCDRDHSWKDVKSNQSAVRS